MRAKTVREHEPIGLPDWDSSSYDEQLRDGLCLNPKAAPPARKYFLQWDPLAVGVGYVASYVVGVQWVKTSAHGKFPLAVLPKVEDIDYLEMFMQCFSNPDGHESFHEIYGIDFEADPIENEALESILSPLLVVQYVHLVQQLLHKDLRKSYVPESGNLHKVRGRIAISTNFRTNVMRGRQHKVCCDYQEYTSDTIENRIIKKALTLSKALINRLRSASVARLNALINVSLSKMAEVSDNVSLCELRSVKYNPIYKGYREALKLARYILRRYDFHLSDASGSLARIPPFWVDMPLLFEHYVGGILARAYPGDIVYQAKGKTGYPDFLSKKAGAILDAKYKPQLDRNNPETDIVRQLAGYSRDCAILDLIGADGKTIVPCAFIYPDGNAADKGDVVFSRPLSELLSPASGYAVKGLTDFYCIGIRVPKLAK